MRGFLAESAASKFMIARSERYYAGIKDDPRLHVKLTGSWETLVGNQDTFGGCSHCASWWFIQLPSTYSPHTRI